MTEKTFGKKALAVIGIAGLVAGGAVAGFVADDSNKVNDLITQNVDLQAQIDNAALVEPVEVIVEVPVDNENLGLVLDHIYELDGDINYMTDDLDDDEVDKIVERIVFVNEAKAAAVAEVKKKLFDEIDDRWGSKYDEDNMDRLRIDDDFDEIEFKIDDWDDQEATVTVKGTFEDDGHKQLFTAELIFDDGEFDEFGVINVDAH